MAVRYTEILSTRIALIGQLTDTNPPRGGTRCVDAMEAIVPPHLRRGVFQPTDKLIALLKRAS